MSPEGATDGSPFGASEYAQKTARPNDRAVFFFLTFKAGTN